jgi:hypothetical protein
MHQGHLMSFDPLCSVASVIQEAAKRLNIPEERLKEFGLATMSEGKTRNLSLI